MGAFFIADDCGSELPLLRFCGILILFMLINSVVSLPQQVSTALAA